MAILSFVSWHVPVGTPAAKRIRVAVTLDTAKGSGVAGGISSAMAVDDTLDGGAGGVGCVEGGGAADAVGVVCAGSATAGGEEQATSELKTRKQGIRPVFSFPRSISIR